MGKGYCCGDCRLGVDGSDGGVGWVASFGLGSKFRVGQDLLGWLVWA